MNTSKEERSAFTKSFGEAIFLLPLPVVIIASLVVVRVNLPGFWTEIITAFSATIIALLIANRPAAKDNYDDSEITFRNLLIISAGGTMLMALINHNNPNQNYFGPVLWVVTIALSVLFLVILFAGDNFRVWQYGKYNYYSGFSKIIAIFAIIGMFSEMYIHFGTQFIWVPMIALTCFIETFFADPRVRRHLDFNEELRYLLWVPAVVASVSTLYQFWFSKIAYGYELWQVLIGVAVILVIIGVIILCIKEAEEAKTKKLEKQQSIQRKAEQEKQAKQREEENTKQLQLATLAIKAIKEEEAQKWSEILFVARYYNQDINKFPEILPKIHKAPLEQVVSISKIKKQIVWTGDFQVALQVIEKLATKSYKDDELELLIKQVDDFIKLIDQHKDFAGYKEARDEIRTRCATIYKMLPKE